MTGATMIRKGMWVQLGVLILSAGCVAAFPRSAPPWSVDNPPPAIPDPAMAAPAAPHGLREDAQRPVPELRRDRELPRVEPPVIELPRSPQIETNPQVETQRPERPEADDSAPGGLPAEIGPRIIPQQAPAAPEIDLTVRVPDRKQVGSGATYKLTITNRADEPAEDVVIESEFDAALFLPGHRAQKARQSLGTLLPDETKEVALTLASDEVGRHCARFTVTSQGREAIWKSVCVEFLPKRLDLALVGPVERTVGSRAEYTVKFVNRSDEPIRNLQAVVAHDGALVPREASEGVHREPGRLSWELGDLQPGEGVQLQVEFECGVAAKHACLRVDVQGDNIPDEQADACLQVEAVEGILDLRIADRVDPVPVGGETEYVVTVQNRGLNAARNVQLSVVIPSVLRVASAEVHEGGNRLTVGHRLEGETLVFDPVPSLAADGVLTFTIHAKALHAGDGRAIARMTHAVSDAPVEAAEPTTVNPE